MQAQEAWLISYLKQRRASLKEKHISFLPQTLINWSRFYRNFLGAEGVGADGNGSPEKESTLKQKRQQKQQGKGKNVQSKATKT